MHQLENNSKTLESGPGGRGTSTGSSQQDILTSTDTMAHYDVNLPTVVTTDASNVDREAVVFQV